jgi:DNA invertase Pin-like site-specific DNA recombinase
MRSPSTRKAFGYVRVSTDRQATEGVSLEAQRERIAAWCTAHGFELAAVHVDAGLSGKRADNRPELQRAIETVCAEGGVLVVYSLSRLARSTRDTLEIADRLDRADADLVSLSESIDTTNAAGRMLFRMLAVLAEFERDLVGERTRCAMASKRARNENTGGRIPFGFRLASDGVHLEPAPLEQAIAERILDLRRGGLSFRAIGASLALQGVAPRTGRTWSPKVLRDICSRGAVA